jgi:hypothetical protein
MMYDCEFRIISNSSTLYACAKAAATACRSRYRLISEVSGVTSMVVVRVVFVRGEVTVGLTGCV